MLDLELLNKFKCWTKEELDKVYVSQFEPMAFPWLDEVKQYIEDTYDIKLITIAYGKILNDRHDNTHKFYICLYGHEDFQRIAIENGFIVPKKLQIIEDHITDMIEKNLKCSNDEKIICRVSGNFFVNQARRYLSMKKSFELKNEIEAFFSHLSPVYFSPENPVICVFETKEEARSFLLSDEYNKIRNQIFDLLKPYDDYDVLKESDIQIFADFKENMERIPMYSRWVRDLGQKEWDEHFESIINR